MIAGNEFGWDWDKTLAKADRARLIAVDWMSRQSKEIMPGPITVPIYQRIPEDTEREINARIAELGLRVDPVLLGGELRFIDLEPHK